MNKQKPPKDWRTRDVTSNPDLSTEEKETSLAFPNDKDRGDIYSDVSTIIKWVQSVEAAEPVFVHLTDGGEIVGIKAKIPKSIVKLQANPRKSTAHSQMISYGDMRDA